MFAWTDDRVAELKALWIEGLTASQIANKMGVASRSAVIGKAHRLRLASRTDNTWRRPHEREVKSKKRKPALAARIQIAHRVRWPIAPPAPIESPIQAGGVSLLDLEQHQCRYAVTPDFATSHRFCGCKTVPGLSYCEGHARLAYRVPDATPRTTFIPRLAGVRHDVTVIKNASELLDA